MKTAKTPRERHLERRARRQLRPQKGGSGFTPSTGSEKLMREERALAKVIKRKLKAGRPGRPGNAPTPKFDWETVVKASQKTKGAA